MIFILSFLQYLIHNILVAHHLQPSCRIGEESVGARVVEAVEGFFLTDGVSSFLILPVLKCFNYILGHVVKALRVQQVVVSYETLVDEVLPLQPPIHGLWRDAQPLGAALHGHRGKADAVVGGCPVVSCSCHNLITVYQNTATKIQLFYEKRAENG